MTTSSRTTIETVRTVVEQLPGPIRADQNAELARFAYEVDLVTQHVPRGSAVCDIGAGWGVLALVLAASGMRSTLLDDFGDAGYREPYAKDVFALWERYGVRSINRDPSESGLGLEPESLDAITTFDCLEHWHRSPKRMLHQAMEVLKPGGLLVIGTPNSANLRKRIDAVLGRTAWSAMGDWYEPETFRGHVREPNVADLLYMGRDIGLESMEILGRNFAGLASTQPWWVRAVTPLADRVLKVRPSLCSNIYLLGRKPRA